MIRYKSLLLCLGCVYVQCIKVPNLRPLEKYVSIDTFLNLAMPLYRRTDARNMKDVIANWSSPQPNNKSRRVYSELYKPTQNLIQYFPIKTLHKRAKRQHHEIQHRYSTIKLCLALENNVRAARLGIREYFEVRTRYKNTFEYEVGYITQDIIHKYKSILELYHFIDSQYVVDSEDAFIEMEVGVANVDFMLYFYKVILINSISIINLCNLLYVLPEKYENTRSMFDAPDPLMRRRPQAGPSSDEGEGEAKGEDKEKGPKKKKRKISFEEKMRRKDQKKLEEFKEKLKDMVQKPLWQQGRQLRQHGKPGLADDYGWPNYGFMYP